MKPTRIRFLVVALTTLVAVCLYLDRFCVNMLAKYISEQFRLSDFERNFLLDAFFYTYALAQMPGGWLADRYGARLMLAIYLAVWSALTGLMGLATGFTTLLIFRLGCGLFEAGAYPACAGLIRRWFPPEQRGFASGIVSIGGRVGGAFAPALTAWMALSFLSADAPSNLTEADILNPSPIRAALKDHANSEVKMAPLARALAKHWASSIPIAEKQLNDAETLVPFLNSQIARRDLTNKLDLQSFAHIVPPEAMTLFQKSDPTPSEVERRNRLLLETAFPQGIRKLLGQVWPYPLFVYGFPGILLALVFWILIRDWPHEHPWCNSAEVKFAEGVQPVSAEQLKTAITTHPPATPVQPDAGPSLGVLWKSILASPAMWFNSVVQFGTNFAWVFLASLVPIYLQEAHQVPIGWAGFMTTLPFMCSIPMMIIGGWMVDRLTRNYGVYWGRVGPLVVTRWLAALGYVACLFFDTPWPIVAAFCVVSLASDSGLPAIWAFSIDLGRKNAGLVLGYGNMWGNLGAAVSATTLGFVRAYARDQYGDAQAWNAVFITCAIVFFLTGLASFGLDSRKPLVADDAS